MARVRSVDFLPEIFQTDANKQFLAATLDQLIQEPKFKKTQGFIGKTVGPGVNPNDKYVIEPNKVRADYQLEPGVVSLKPDTDTIKDAITYPGINDAIGFFGGDQTRPDRLYSSEYYTWDPFVDFDAFVNFSQYFWVPGGPDSVDVSSTGIPSSDNFVVTRANGVYTFSGLAGENPTIEMVRGGNYSFQVAQNNKETVNYRVQNTNNSAYKIDYQTNPVITLARGNTYVFNLNLTVDAPFWIKTAQTTGTGDAYNSGVSRNGAVTGVVTFVVPQDAPDTLYYASENQIGMRGQINIIDGTPGTGPGFWIQTNPGILGTIPTTPNISSRDVFGVVNNGEDLGTVTFNVPRKDSQQFYYNLTSIGTIDLLTDLKFDQINNIPVTEFNATYGGIDGITSLDTRTLVFTNPLTDAVDGGWIRTSLSGGPDTIIPPEDRYQSWQISYTMYAGVEYITLNKISNIPDLNKFTIRYGSQWSNTGWYKDDLSLFKQIPLLSAVQDTLYYQDGTDPEIFGRIKLIDQLQDTTLFVDEIIGKKTYTAPNGVVFTNGLKIVFRGDVEPVSYEGQEYYVSGVGTAIELLPVGNFITPEAYVVDEGDSAISTTPTELDYLTISRASKDLNAWTRSNRWFHIDVLNATAEYNNTTAVLDNNYRAKRPIIQFRPGIRMWNMGTEGKQPVDVIDFEETDALSNVEGRTSYSVDGYDFVSGTRVIFAADEDQDVKNKIFVVSFIEPDSIPLTTAANLSYGATYRIVSLGTTDWNAVADTVGITYAVGDTLVARNAGTGTGTANFAEPIINLTQSTDGAVLADQSTICLEGNTLHGLTFWYNGTNWAEAQLKNKVQQAPLFNVYDSTGISFGDQTKYQSSTFSGSKLFSYAVGDTTLLDPILQFPLQYLNINNVGDIVFENNLYKDTFLYVLDNVSVVKDISSGSARDYLDRVTYDRLIGWQTAATPSEIRQQFKFTYSGSTLKLDIKVSSDNVNVPAVKIYVGSNFIDPTKYTVSTTDNSTIITLNETYVIGDIIEVIALSSQTSNVGFYQVPVNLESNPLNGNSDSFTLGTIRTHYQSICENLNSIVGNISGPNNTRDLGNIVPYGLVILQQSSPLTLAGYFLRSDDYNIFAALQFNSREYTKFKGQMLQSVTQQNIQYQTASQVLDTAIEDITLGKLESQPFYWSDMIPASAVYTTTTYTVSFITTNTFDTVEVYDYTSANYKGMNVYLNNRLLTRGLEYTVATDGPRITILITLAVGDIISIQEYETTYGSFVPNTPTKLGLYPAWRPEIITQTTTDGTEVAIRGHDGSITKAFGDIRDQVLLEFETRIFNNLKLDGNPVPLTIADVLPGQFRDTGFSFEEINNIFAVDFLNYCGWNKLDYKNQRYSSSNEFSWNYSGSQNKLNDENLLGAWRGINRYFYDTEQPQQTPWEMLGFSIIPDWWEETYGAAPYTQDNLVLWDDLEAGYVADPIAPYYLPEYARPGLTQVIPSGTQGELLSPFDSVVGKYNQSTFQKSWSVGDGGPVEASWWNSSDYPFSVMHVLAVTRPAKFFALFADRDLYKFNDEFGQYLYNNRYRLDANGIEVYGNGTSKASFIDWIVDFNRQTGLDSTVELTDDLANLDVRLCYRMASFSDKQYIKLFTEKSSPNSTNTTLMIPDDSYDLLLYKNQPFDRSSYSSVVIQKVAGGYAVFGYSTSQPYFEILASKTTGKFQTVSSGGTSVQVPTFYTNTVVQVPYGFIFSNVTSVVDFLLSYGQLLVRQGLSFTDTDNGYILSWGQMAQEFLYWSQQGWNDNALINLNPLAFKLSVTRDQAIVDDIRVQTTNDVLLDQNRRELPSRNLNITRIDNTFTIEPLTNQSLSFIDLRFTSYEHMIVLKNQSVFGDLIYAPTTGARQSRLKLVALTTTEWNGSVDAQGFILNQDNVEEWTGLRTYAKGEIVKYKNVYWSATTIVQPSELFNYNDWTQSDYTQIELGMLPNLANKADQLQNTYSINTANIESDNDLLAYGLIGFRPRQYMAALNLDDVSQVNIYRQFLDTKGTVQAAELFKQANLGKEAAEYDIYENWAVQRAVYGANANRSYVELKLNRALLNSNPSLVQVVLPQQQSQADQQILLSDVWKQSYKLTSPDFLPTTTTLPTDIALPTAGYVSLDDTDINVFDINDPSSLEANINNISVGTSIWVAKINNYDWNIYRAQQVPGQIQHVCDNLDDTSRVIFSTVHNLSVGDKLIIRFFDVEVDGVYEVLSIPDINTVNISFQFTGGRVVVDGTGIGFTLKTMRVAQASDIVDLPYANEILPGAKVWVDNNGNDQWEVLEKRNVFDNVIDLTPVLLDALEQYGASVAQASNRYASLVGSPRYGFGTGIQQGAVYLYVKNYSDQYAPVSPVANGDAILTLDAPGVRGYGNAVDFGSQTWAVAGASKSLGTASIANSGYACVIYRDPALGQPGVIPYAQWQMLVPDSSVDRALAGEFGYSIAMSQDERWLYVGAPGINKIFAYGRVEWQNQFIRDRSDGATVNYYIGSVIQIDAATQIKVTVDGKILTLGVDYVVDAGFNNVTFAIAPVAGTLIDISRISIQQLDFGTYYDVQPSATSGAGVGAEFSIVRQRGEVGQPGTSSGSVGATSLGSGYAISDTITIDGADFGSTNNIVLTVTSIGAGGTLGNFDIAYTPPALETTFSLNEYFFTVDNIYSFSIRVGDVLQRPVYDYTFDTVTRNITFVTVPPVGAVIVATAQSYFDYIDEITIPGLVATDRFGHAISCTTDGRQVIVGTPYSTVNGETEAGNAYVFDRSVQRFIYGEDGSTVNFTLAGTPIGPISVIVNNVFLINETDATVNAPNSFYWNGANTVTINADLALGDIIEIETNQFQLVQQVDQNIAAEFSNFGTAVELCAYNCSLYIGEPQSSVQVYKGGAIEREVNQSRIYGTITATVPNPSLVAGNTIRVNNIEVAVPVAPNQNVIGLASAINAAVPNVTATVSSTGYLTISVKNSDAAPQFDKVQVAPGLVGNTFAILGFKTFVNTQTIVSPYPIEFAGFGSSISVNDNASSLVVGAPRGSLYIEILWDDNTTIWDAGSTIFFSVILQSGVVYTYDYLPSSTLSISNPGMFVFGEQIGKNTVYSYDNFGIALSYNSGVLMVGSPGNDSGDSSSSDFGTVFVFENANRLPAWTIIREQQPVVDIQLLNSVFLYDRITSARTQFLDFFNPLQGKILGAARQNIDYISGIDPAAYNVGPVNIRGTTWGENQVGQVWWDISTVRFIDPNQDDIVYASRRWGQVFPGSSVDVYQWIVSPVPPSDYTGPGTPFDTLSYSINSRLTKEGVFVTEYYFWVQGITTTDTRQGKTLSIATVAQYIENPRASGISYLAPINGSTVALYNSGDYIEASDTILDIEFDREYTNNNVHVEYELIPQDRADGFLSDNLYRKLQDSFCGTDTFGNLVPDQNLSVAERYGVQFRPRQSMFVDRFEALRNYLTRVNNVLSLYPISESRSFNILNSNEPEPSSNSIINPWNLRVANLEILGFQNIYAVPLGYKYLVVSDSDNRGLWTIYTVESDPNNIGGRLLVLTRVQGYNTPDYWSYIDWYLPGYNTSTKVVAEVPVYASLNTLTVPVGSSVRVTANAQGKWEIYLLMDTGWARVGLQDGTIEFSAELWDYALGRFGFDVEVFDAQYFDQEPVIETRKVIQAINEELFVDDLLIERNKAMVLMFNYVLSEFAAPEWLVKTSLIDVNHNIRQLIPFQNYTRDNQEFVSDYIQEVKPYHVQIREFNLKYTGFDRYAGDLADFDVPAYYNTSLAVPKYTSPILLPYALSSYQTNNTESDASASSTIWATWPYSQWYNNYLLTLDSISMVELGSGYTEPPAIVINGDATVPAEAVAVINSQGQIVAINVTDPGSGYRNTPTVEFDGGNGSGARAYAVMNNGLVRSLRTVIKYDRFQYNTSVETWSQDGTYENGTLVRYDNRVWRAENADGSTANTGPTFNLEDWVLVPASELTGIDRTMGFYVPGANQPGLELPLLVDGVDYPGVQVWGNHFLGTIPLDTVYESAFTDTTLGTTYSSINANGGEFIGPYEGHAPEELVNGAEFDTLDLRVYTRPGSDWQFDGHGFEMGTIRYTYDSTVTRIYSWAGVVEHPVQILVNNLTTGLDLTLDLDYTIDWVNQSIEIVQNVSDGNIINIGVYELGGGSQLYRANYIGAELSETVVVPVNSAEIESIAVFVNGQNVNSVTWEPYVASVSWDILDAYEKLDIVNNSGNYYRALQSVPAGIAITNTTYWFEFVPVLESLVDFGTDYGTTDGIAIVVFGVSTINAGQFIVGREYTIASVGTTDFISIGAADNDIGTVFVATGVGSGSGTANTNYSWSTPQVEYFVADAGLVLTQTLTVTNNLNGTNPANLVVTRNGRRLQPAEGIEWIGDDSSVSFGLPQRGNYQQNIIYPPTDISVWVDDILQIQSVGSITGSYSVSNWDGSNTPGRQVVFNDPPAAGARILISVSTIAEYLVIGNRIQLVPLVNIGDIYAVTSWNDTAQQNALTLVFVGPIETGITVSEPFDSTGYDVGLVTGDTGSYDYSEGTLIPTNDFNLNRENVNGNRLWVTLNGYQLINGNDFTIEGQYLILSSGAIGPADIMVVTEFTDSVVPEAIAFRVFQDMRGVQATYRITEATTTYLTQGLSYTADIAYVDDASKLSEPDLPNGIFGLVTIGGERIMYRTRDLSTNTISGLRRGTAGTAADDHAVNVPVYDISRGNLLPEQYQDYIVSDTSLGDGSTTLFYAPNIDLIDFGDSSTMYVESIEVYVGGVRQYNYSDTTAESQYRWIVTDFGPLAIEFIVDDTVVPALTAPLSGVEVTILQRRGHWWYNLATPNLSLQETDSNAARFLRGE